jgi:hypothetical protein
MNHDCTSKKKEGVDLQIIYNERVESWWATMVRLTTSEMGRDDPEAGG